MRKLFCHALVGFFLLPPAFADAPGNVRAALDNEIFQDGYIDEKSRVVLDGIERQVNMFGMIYHDLYGFEVNGWFNKMNNGTMDSGWGENYTGYAHYTGDKSVSQKIQELKTFIQNFDGKSMTNNGFTGSIRVHDINDLNIEYSKTMRELELISNPALKEALFVDLGTLQSRVSQLGHNALARDGMSNNPDMSDNMFIEIANELRAGFRNIRSCQRRMSC